MAIRLNIANARRATCEAEYENFSLEGSCRNANGCSRSLTSSEIQKVNGVSLAIPQELAEEIQELCGEIYNVVKFPCTGLLLQFGRNSAYLLKLAFLALALASTCGYTNPYS